MKSASQFLRFPCLVAVPLAVAALLVGASLASAQTAPSLGLIQQFSVLGGSATTGSTGSGTTVTGDVGSCPTSTVTNFPPSTVVSPFILHNAAACDGTVTTARANATAAFNFLGAPQGAGTTIADNLTGQSLGPGVYNLGAALLPNGATLTLNGPGVFVFRTASTLTTVGSSTFVLNNVDPCSIFWQVGSSATIDSLSGFPGNIFALASITISSATSVTGRAIAGTAGFVTMSGSGGNTIGGCATPPIAPCPAITLSPATLPNGTIAIPYSQTITASGGLAPYTFTLTAGALPGGLSLAPGGAISGTPTTAGTFTFTVQAADSNGCLGTRIYTIVIPAPVCPAITLSPATLPNGGIALPYSQSITASGGLAPYTFTLIAGSLPNGLFLAPGGAISGTPTTAGTFTFTVQAADSNGCLGNRVYTIVVPPPGCPAIALAPATLPNGAIAIPYSQALTASGGLAPYTFTLIAGSLPTALSLSPGGSISGTPTTAGTFTFTVQATDNNGCPGAQTYTIVIPAPVCPAITLSPATLPNGGIAIPYSQSLTASGGLAPYTFTLIAGSLPNGLSLAPGGAISGTPTTAGTFTFTVQAADSNGCPGTRIYTIVVPPPGCPVIVLAPTSVPGGTVGVAYNQTFTGSGGLAPYSFTVTAGSLPPGLTLSTGGLLSGTPTTVGSSSFTIRATDANGCFGALNYTIAVTAVPVPTLSEWAMIGLIFMLAAVSYLALRRQIKTRAI